MVSEPLNSVAKFKLSAGERQREVIHLSLDANVNSGPQLIRADFTVAAERTYRFSCYRTIQVGLGDIEVELASRLDEHGNLVVEQQLINTTDQFVSFNCLLFAEGRRRQRRQVYHLSRGRATNVFVLPQGEQLLGTTLWLRAEEIGGSRVLNRNVIAER
jgi:hypothetical protein